MTSFSITAKAVDAAGKSATSLVSVLVAPASGGGGTGSIVDGRDIRANPSLVGCRLAASSLTLHSGDYTAKAGEAISGLHITGQYNAAAGSSATDCHIDSSINTYPGDPSGVVISYCNIGQVGVKSGNGSPGLRFGGATLQYCHIAGFSDGIFCNNGTTFIDACYIHGLLQTVSSSEHNDLIQMSNGNKTTVNRCWLDRDDHLGQVSCGGIYKSDNGPITGLTVSNNLLTNSGGSSGIQALIWYAAAGGGVSGGVFTGNFVQEYAFSIVFNSNAASSTYKDSGNQWWNPTVGANGAMTFAGGGARQKT